MAKFLTLNEFSSLSADKSAVASVAEAMYRRVNTFRLKGNKQNTYDISERETAHAALYYGALIVKRHFSREGYDRAQMLDSAWEKLNYFASMRRYTGHLQLLMVDMLVNEHYRPRISNRPDLRIDDETANSLAQELLAETEKNTHNKENQIRVPQNHGVTRKRGMGDHVPQFMGNLQKVRASLLGEAFEQQRDLEKAAAEHTSTNAELDTNPAIAPLEAATKPQAAVRKRKRVIYEDDDEHPSSTASTTSEAISPPKRAKLTDNATPSSAIVENSDDDMDLDEDDIHEESSSSSSGAPEQKQKVILTPAMKERIEQIYKQQKQNKKVNFIDIALIIEREFHIKIKKSTINNYIAININKNQAQRIHFDNETINATREMAQTFLDNNEKINLGHIAKIVFPEFHCDTARKYVSTILENLGIRKKIKYLKLSDEQKLQIDRLHHEEKKITEICLELNINERKIRNYLKYKKTIS